MTGTTGELNLATCTDSDDTENYLTVSLAQALTILDALFNATAGHDHSGAHKGKPITTAGIAAGAATGVALGSDVATLTGAQTLTNKTLTSPHMTSPVIDSGGLTITAGASDLGPGAVSIGGGTRASSGALRIANNTFISWRNNGNTNDVAIGVDTTDRLVLGNANVLAVASTVGAAGGASALPATPLGYLRVALNGAEVKIAYWNP